jgi:hypothetical protein
MALVAHRREQGVAGLELRRRPRRGHVGAPPEPVQLTGPPLFAQFLIAPALGDQLSP